MVGGEFAGIDLAVMPETACLRGSRKVERKTIMKKLMFAAAVAAAGLTYGLESSNTVGYQTYPFDTDIGEYLNNVGVAFKHTGESADWTFSTNIFDQVATVGDQVILFSADDWNLVSYTFKGFDGSGNSKGWEYNDADFNSSIVASFTVSKGDVLYFQPGDGVTTALVSGEVEASGTKTVTFDTTGGDWIFDIVNPFPKATTLADLETFCEVGDQVILFDQMAWNLVSYTFKGVDGLGASKGWEYNDADFNSSIITDTSTVVLKPGQGGYLQPGGSRTWNVTCNY